jgi:hypothetical protein
MVLNTEKEIAMSGTRRHVLRLLLSLLVVAVFLFGSSLIALADSGTGTANVNGGTLSELISASPTTTSVTLNGTDQTLTNTFVLTVEDSTGTGAGWNLTLSATNFTGSGDFNGSTTPTTESLASSGTLSITNVTVSCVSGSTCTNPTSTFTYPGSVAVTTAASSPTPVKFYNANTGTGMGKFTVEPTLTIFIPANAYATTYSSTITLAIASAP